jgi:hypothetical protein
MPCNLSRANSNQCRGGVGLLEVDKVWWLVGQDIVPRQWLRVRKMVGGEGGRPKHVSADHRIWGKRRRVALPALRTSLASSTHAATLVVSSSSRWARDGFPAHVQGRVQPQAMFQRPNLRGRWGSCDRSHVCQDRCYWLALRCYTTHFSVHQNLKIVPGII